MSDEKLIYICFRRNDDGKINAVQTGETRAAVEIFSQKQSGSNTFVRVGTLGEEELKKERGDDQVQEKNKSSSIADYCYETMSLIDQKIAPFHHLIELATIFRHGLQSAGIEQNIYKFAKENGSECHKDESIETYSVTLKQFDNIRSTIREMKEVDEGMQILPSSILLSLVATFDSIIGEFVRCFLSSNPNLLDTGNKTIYIRELFQIEDIKSHRSKIIEDEVGDFLRGSHKKQVEYLERIIDTSISDKYERWPNFIEIFERRNVYAHANGFATSEYLNKIRDVKYPLDNIEEGVLLNLSTSYLHKSVDILTEFGTILAFVAWRKNSDETSHAFVALSHAAYTLITKRRFNLAIKLLDFALHRQSRKGVSESTIRQMYVNLANAYKKTEKRISLRRLLRRWTGLHHLSISRFALLL